MKIIQKCLLLCVLAFPFKEAFSSGTLYINSQSDVHKLSRNINQYSQIKFAAGTFLLPELVFYRQVLLVGSGSSTILKPASPTTYMIIARKPLVLKNLVLDGNHQASVGLYANQDLEVESCTLQNFKGTAKAAGRAIRTLGYNSSLRVNNTTIRNIGGYEDGKGGNAIGAHRGIHSLSKYNRISNSTFDNIQGKEDGDAIHLQTKRVAGKWASANSVIEHCRFINFGKRAIKLQSSHNLIQNCDFVQSAAAPASVVISLYGENNTIKNNDFKVAVTVSWISLNGAAINTISGNTVKMSKGSKLFYVTKTRNTQIVNNQFEVQDSKKPLTGFSPNTEKADFNNLNLNNTVSPIK